jgi:hypothetical protein
MKKNLFITGLSLTVVIFLIIKYWEDDIQIKDKQESIVQNNIVTQPVSTSKKIVFSKKDTNLLLESERTPATKKKYTKTDLLSGFLKQEINFFKEPVFLVEGVFASLNLRKGTEPITQVAGLNIYDTPGEKSLQVVFSPSKGTYGIFTGEIILNGEFQSALNYLEKTSYEVLYQNEVTQKIIIRVDNISDLSSLEDIKSNPGLSISPDLKFARVKSLTKI